MLDSYITILNRTIGASIGRPVQEVIYRTYEDSTSRAAIAEGAGWLHGEVLLGFPGVPRLFIGWGENEGWSDHFSLLPSETSTFKLGTLADLAALDAPEWAAVQNQPLKSAELRGSNGTPHLLVLEFTAGGVVIGDGNNKDLGDGDQILVHVLPDPQMSEFHEVFWRAHDSAG